MAGCGDGIHHTIRTGDRLSSRSSEVIVPLSLKKEACEMAYRDGEPICRAELIAGREAWGKVVAETKKPPGYMRP